MDKYSEIRVPIAHDNPSIKRHETKCVLCGKCKDVCKKKLGVADYWKYDSEDIVCINCGQCANVCPVGAITEQDDSAALIDAIKNKNKKVIFIVSPASRVSLGEMFNLPTGTFVAGKLVSALKKLGADFVFDVTYGADLTIMEEATEIINRIKENKNLPQFTSCCPAWVKFVETFYPQYIPNLSTCKSPISMQTKIIKTYFANTQNIDPKDLYICAITPCVAKKFEIKRPELSGIYGSDTNLVLSVRELAGLLKKQRLNFKTLKDSQFDSLLPTGSGAGIIFGASGGVMEAALRTAHFLTTGKQPEKDFLCFKKLRGYNDTKVASVKLLDKTLKVGSIFGTNSARRVLDKLKQKKFDFIEVMACPNGCVGGGGQPKQFDNDTAVIKRAESLYLADANAKIKSSFENPEIQKLYKEYLSKPASTLAEKLLHTTYQKRNK